MKLRATILLPLETGKVACDNTKISSPNFITKLLYIAPYSTDNRSKITILLPKQLIKLFLKGNILRSEIDGCIQMRNFVASYPEVKIALNEDFFVGKSDVVSRGKLTSSSLKEKNIKVL